MTFYQPMSVLFIDVAFLLPLPAASLQLPAPLLLEYAVFVLNNGDPRDMHMLALKMLEEHFLSLYGL